MNDPAASGRGIKNYNKNCQQLIEWVKPKSMVPSPQVNVAITKDMREPNRSINNPAGICALSRSGAWKHVDPTIVPHVKGVVDIEGKRVDVRMDPP